MKRQKNSHYKLVNGELVPKRSFDNENEAIEVARFLNTKENANYKIVVYKCDLCGKWHIGHNGKKLFNDDKNKYKEKLHIFIKQHSALYEKTRLVKRVNFIH